MKLFPIRVILWKHTQDLLQTLGNEGTLQITEISCCNRMFSSRIKIRTTVFNSFEVINIVSRITCKLFYFLHLNFNTDPYFWLPNGSTINI